MDSARGLRVERGRILEGCLGKGLLEGVTSFSLVTHLYLPAYFSSQPCCLPLLIVFPTILKPLIILC